MKDQRCFKRRIGLLMTQRGRRLHTRRRNSMKRMVPRGETENVNKIRVRDRDEIALAFVTI